MGWAYAERSHRTAPMDLNLEMPKAPRSFRDLEPGAVSAAIAASRGASYSATSPVMPSGLPERAR